MIFDLIVGPLVFVGLAALVLIRAPEAQVVKRVEEPPRLRILPPVYDHEREEG